MQTAEGVAGPEQVLSDREEEDSDDESSPFNQLVDAALGLAAEEGGNLAGEQQRQRPTRQSRASARAAGLSLEDCVIDADMEQDQQRVARVRGQSAAAAALGQAGGTTGAEVGGTTAAGRKRKVLCL